MANTVRIRNGMSNATEGDILGNFGDLVGVGVVDKANGHLLVTEDSPRGMSIQVAGGIVYVPNADYNQLDSDTPKFYPVVCDAEALTIDNNTSGQTRNDIVCVKVDKSIFPDADASNIATKVVVKGTAGGGIPTTPANHYKLAEIEVVNGETEIENSMITDTREQITLQERLINLTASSTTNITGLVGGDGTNIEQVTKPTGDIVGTTDTQTLTNKTVSAADNTLTGVVTLTGTQTLTNKTLTAPTLTSPAITSSTTGIGLINESTGFTLTSGSTQSMTIGNYVYGFLFIVDKSTGAIGQIAIYFGGAAVVYQNASEFAITSTPSTSQTGIYVSTSVGNSDTINVKNGFTANRNYAAFFIRLQ